MRLSRAIVGSCVLVLTAGLLTTAQADPGGRYFLARSTPREDPYYPTKGDPRLDALHYGLNLRWSAATKTLQGTARIAFRSMRDTGTVLLDLGKPLRVSSVRLDGAVADFAHGGNHLSITTGPLRRLSRHTLTIAYAGSPRAVHAPTTRSDIDGLGWTTEHDGSVWTMQEPYGAFTWYPVNDQPSDKAYYDARIDAPGSWVGIFNGQLTSRKRIDGRTVTRWHLDSPAASYLTTIAIGDYTEFSDRGPHGLPITYWVPKSGGHLRSLREIPQLVRWLEERLGRFPFDRIGALIVPSDSAMETQTMVTMGTGIFQRGDYRAVLLHELAHQWYGDTVTPDNWKDLWLNESFAMYIEARWQNGHGGPRFAEQMSAWESADQQYRTSDGPPGAYHRLQFGEGSVYYCGAVMLNELRKKVGTQLFNVTLRSWIQRHRAENADRGDYVAFMNAESGMHLGPFLHRWLTSKRSPVH